MPGTAQSTGTTDAIRPHPSRRRDVVIYFVRYRLLFRPAASPSVVVVVVVAVVVAVVLERGTAKEFRFQFRFAFFLFSINVERSVAPRAFWLATPQKLGRKKKLGNVRAGRLENLGAEPKKASADFPMQTTAAVGGCRQVSSSSFFLFLSSYRSIAIVESISTALSLAGRKKGSFLGTELPNRWPYSDRIDTYFSLHHEHIYHHGNVSIAMS